ncbi:Flp family type IVb pilin [Vibrio sp. SM6]|uniref:Flp family type IVb pilin n=1 Tax=Vibrio agarilyticus TaxID=2726741 RepID=A0A7X8YHW5_9VIBR|nr:Flp family type IVb pilin [Vibrio agarilyticus]NLS13777.1 Flp family type IVb pilin [Vibrio agarilyticus]
MLTKLFVKTQVALENYKQDQNGVTAVEYGLIAAAMAALLGVIFAGDGSFVTSLKGVFTTIATSLSTPGIS